MVSVGEKLWLVREGWRTPDPVTEKEVTVTKVGRAWFYVDNEHDPSDHRYSIDSMREDGRGYVSRAQCYRSREEYRMALESDRVWGLISAFVRSEYVRPKQFDMLTLWKVADLLGVDTPRHCNPCAEIDLGLHVMPDIARKL